MRDKPYFCFFYLSSKMTSHTCLPYYLIFTNRLLANKLIRFRELVDNNATKV